eukprot:Lankesteria_metandrocarpae@DN5288_c0_g1_i12.p1
MFVAVPVCMCSVIQVHFGDCLGVSFGDNYEQRSNHHNTQHTSTAVDNTHPQYHCANDSPELEVVIGGAPKQTTESAVDGVNFENFDDFTDATAFEDLLAVDINPEGSTADAAERTATGSEVLVMKD